MGSTVFPSEIKAFIIKTLALEDQNPEDMPDDLPLFEGGLGLDSIDGLELAIALRKSFHVTWPLDASLKDHLQSPLAIARSITRSVSDACQPSATEHHLA